MTGLRGERASEQWTPLSTASSVSAEAYAISTATERLSEIELKEADLRAARLVEEAAGVRMQEQTSRVPSLESCQEEESASMESIEWNTATAKGSATGIICNVKYEKLTSFGLMRGEKHTWTIWCEALGRYLDCVLETKKRSADKKVLVDGVVKHRANGSMIWEWEDADAMIALRLESQGKDQPRLRVTTESGSQEMTSGGGGSRGYCSSTSSSARPVQSTGSQVSGQNAPSLLWQSPTQVVAPPAPASPDERVQCRSLADLATDTRWSPPGIRARSLRPTTIDGAAASVPSPGSMQTPSPDRGLGGGSASSNAAPAHLVDADRNGLDMARHATPTPEPPLSEQVVETRRGGLDIPRRAMHARESQLQEDVNVVDNDALRQAIWDRDRQIAQLQSQIAQQLETMHAGSTTPQQSEVRDIRARRPSEQKTPSGQPPKPPVQQLTYSPGGPSATSHSVPTPSPTPSARASTAAGSAEKSVANFTSGGSCSSASGPRQVPPQQAIPDETGVLQQAIAPIVFPPASNPLDDEDLDISRRLGIIVPQGAGSIQKQPTPHLSAELRPNQAAIASQPPVEVRVTRVVEVQPAPRPGNMTPTMHSRQSRSLARPASRASTPTQPSVSRQAWTPRRSPVPYRSSTPVSHSGLSVVTQPPWAYHQSLPQAATAHQTQYQYSVSPHGNVVQVQITSSAGSGHYHGSLQMPVGGKMSNPSWQHAGPGAASPGVPIVHHVAGAGTPHHYGMATPPVPMAMNRNAPPNMAMPCAFHPVPPYMSGHP
mmetsp:Transcript_12684/g.28491  ORF Transcript_12684/g.28491 Transcript_12684/m.28491 type:complete len:772 (-) Transcript_12684:93-2408(-)